MPEKTAKEQGKKKKSLAAKKEGKKKVLGPKEGGEYIMFFNDELNKQTILPVVDY